MVECPLIKSIYCLYILITAIIHFNHHTPIILARNTLVFHMECIDIGIMRLSYLRFINSHINPRTKR